MNVSPMTTGGVALTAASVEPTVAWAITGFHAAMPESTPMVATVALLALAHWVINLLVKKFGGAADLAPLTQAGQ